MEETLREAAVDSWREGLARSVEEKRARARELLAGGQRRLAELEGQLTQRIDVLAKQLAQGEAHAQQQAVVCDERGRGLETRDRELTGREQKLTKLLDDVQRRLGELQTRQHEVEAAGKELHFRQTECSQKEADLARQQAELGVRHEDVVRKKQELDQQQHALDQAHKAHQAEADKLKDKLAEYQQLHRDLEREKQRLTERELETQKQRRHIAQQLRGRKGEVANEAELHRAEALASAAGQELQLQMRLSEVQAKYEKLRDEVATSGQQTAEANQRAALLQKQLEAKQKEIDTRQKEAGANQNAREQFEALRRQFDTDKQKLHGEGQKKYDDARKQLEAAQGELAKRRAEAEVRGGELARLQAELAKRQAEAEAKGGEAQHVQAELDRVRREMQHQLDTLKSDQAKSQDGQVKSLQAQLDQLRQQYEEERQETQQRQKQLEGELAAAKSGASAAGDAAHELAKLRQQYQQLERQLSAARDELTAGGESAQEIERLRVENKHLEESLTEHLERVRHSAVVTETNQEFEDLRRRFELAVEDVRELKNKNAELTDQLARAKSSPGGSVDAMDWESQKRRMLEQLDSDFSEKDEKGKADKMTVEGAIKITDKIVADKEQEIAELRQLLENQSKNVGEVAVGASAIAAALDGDAIVKQERENLKQLQAKLREELKKAEVDCSLERAKVARERSELEEKMRQFAADKASAGHVEPGVGGADKSKKGGGGGKWLARLGLGSDKAK